MHDLYSLKSFYNGKKVFVTGHTGFKGAWLCLWLRELGAEVTGYALPAPTDPSLYALAGVESDISSIIGDIRDPDSLVRAMQQACPEVVIHMAAQPLVRDSYRIPVDTYAVNVMGTVHLLEAVRMTPSVRAVVNVTTDKCYENREWVWGYRENEAMGGYDPYSSSKGCSELVTAAYRNSFFPAAGYGTAHRVALASARAGNVIGGGDWAHERLLPDILRSFLNNESVSIRSPHAIRPWQHVLEPLSGYLLLGRKLYEDGVAFAEGWNFGPEQSDAKPVAWIVDTMCRLWGPGASSSIDSNPQPHEATYLKLDCSKAHERLGWEPRWSLTHALEQIIKWTRVYQKGGDVRDITREQIREYMTSERKY